MGDSAVADKRTSPPKAGSPNDADNSRPRRSRTQERKMNYAKKLKSISQQVMYDMANPTKNKSQPSILESELSFGSETSDELTEQSSEPSRAQSPIPKSPSPKSPIEMFQRYDEEKPRSSSASTVAKSGNESASPWLKERPIGRSSRRKKEEKDSVLNSILDRINCNVCSLGSTGMDDAENGDPYVSSRGPMIDKEFSFHADNDDLTAATARSKSLSKASRTLDGKLDLNNTRDAADTTISEWSLGTDGSLWTGGTGVMTDDDTSPEEIDIVRNLKEMRQVENAVEKLRIYSEKHGVPMKEILASYDEGDDDDDLYSLYDKGLGKMTTGMVRTLLACAAVTADIPNVVQCCRGEEEDLKSHDNEAVPTGNQAVDNEAGGERSVAGGERSVDSGIEIKGDKYEVALVAGSVDRNNPRATLVAPEFGEGKEDDSKAAPRTPPRKNVARFLGKTSPSQSPTRPPAEPAPSAGPTDVSDSGSVDIWAEIRGSTAQQSKAPPPPPKSSIAKFLDKVSPPSSPPRPTARPVSSAGPTNVNDSGSVDIWAEIRGSKVPSKARPHPPKTSIAKFLSKRPSARPTDANDSESIHIGAKVQEEGYSGSEVEIQLYTQGSF